MVCCESMPNSLCCEALATTNNLETDGNVSVSWKRRSDHTY